MPSLSTVTGFKNGPAGSNHPLLNIGQTNLMKSLFLGALPTLPRVAEDLLDDHTGLRIKPADVRPAAAVATASIQKYLTLIPGGQHGAEAP
jgi:hypothetical protein